MWISLNTETPGPAIPSFCWSWSRQRLVFIFFRNGWLNMTGRKWESEVGDASRHCQITRRTHQISLFLHLVLVISLASFSSLISLVWRYVVGVSSTLHLQWGRTISNSNVILICACLDTVEFERENFPQKIYRCNYLFDIIILVCVEQKIFCLLCHIFAVLKYLQFVY